MNFARAQTGRIEVEQPWTRATSARAQTAVGYLIVHNRGRSEDRLLSASSPLARSVEMHDSGVDANGVMRMRPIEGGVAVPAGGDLRFTPDDGRHLMLVGPTRAFARGERIPLVLNFEKVGLVEIALAVEAAGARAPATGDGGHAGHGPASR
jgi:copper(I)-binding protein